MSLTVTKVLARRRETAFRAFNDIFRTIRAALGLLGKAGGKETRRERAGRRGVLAKQRNAFGKSIASRNIQGSSVAEHNGALLER